jgi:hypothetical protein
VRCERWTVLMLARCTVLAVLGTIYRTIESTRTSYTSSFAHVSGVLVFSQSFSVQDLLSSHGVPFVPSGFQFPRYARITHRPPPPPSTSTASMILAFPAFLYVGGGRGRGVGGGERGGRMTRATELSELGTGVNALRTATGAPGALISSF